MQSQDSGETDWFCSNVVRSGLLSYRGKPLIGLEKDKYGVADNGTWTALSVRRVSSNDTGNYTCRLVMTPGSFATGRVVVGKRKMWSVRWGAREGLGGALQGVAFRTQLSKIHVGADWT